MDVSELIAMKKRLEADIRERLQHFINETGCRPDVSVYTETIQSMGGDSQHIIDVSVNVKI